MPRKPDLRGPCRRLTALALAIGLVGCAGTVFADSSSVRLAAYYDHKMLLCGNAAYRWRGDQKPTILALNITQVGVGRETYYGLHKDGRLLAWRQRRSVPRVILDQVTWFAAGRSGVLALRGDKSLWYLKRASNWFSFGKIAKPVRIAAGARAASVGDSANYYIDGTGRLLVRGLAHRGQYGDGKLTASDQFTAVARDVRAIRAHTGHAILLRQDGTVMGTGGNIYGPLGRHGLGDKAIRWGKIFTGAVAIATGSSHSLALRADGGLWQWGRDIGLDAKLILKNVTDAAADSNGSLAITADNRVWHWSRGDAPKQIFRCS